MRNHQAVLFRWTVVVCLLATALRSNAQTTQGIGVGAFLNVPMVSGNSPLAKDEKLLLRASPYVDYAISLRRWNFMIGAGVWNSTLANEIIDTVGKATTVYSFNYLFAPVGVGFNVLDGKRWNVGLEGYALLKYLMLVNADVRSDNPALAIPVTHINGAELDQFHLNKFGVATGGGLFVSSAFGKILPKLGVGYLTDLKDAFNGTPVNYKFSHVYANVSVNYLIGYSERLEKWDHRVKW